MRSVVKSCLHSDDTFIATPKTKYGGKNKEQDIKYENRKDIRISVRYKNETNAM